MPSRSLDTPPVQIVIVADAHGLPTGDYTFPYVSAWAGQDGTGVVRAAASRVAAAARQIITASTAAHTPGGRATDLELTLAGRPTPDAVPPPTAALRHRPLDPALVNGRELGRGLA